MSVTPHKTTDSHKKNVFNDSIKDIDLEKSLEKIESVDGSNRSTGGAGETPVKKPVKKATKQDDEKTGKKINLVVADKLPKKNAQRARGSITLNRTIAEKTNSEGPEKKRPAGQFNEISSAKDAGHVENVKPDEGKTLVSSRNRDSKTKTVTKKAGKKDPKLSKKQKSWVDTAEKLSTEVEDVGMLLKESPDEMEVVDMHPLNPPLATCSFFEKLQQGVKSYFSTKNSFTPYDKVKKEGGNQTRARVAKGVKEDAKKREPGLIVKNDICSSESDSYHGDLRLNSNLGGQSNNFSSNKPKIFRMLKRKKLYHPKKHYVRIQIPRKGYFYRSVVQLKVPGSTTSGHFQRMDPQDVPKNESKIQISGLASTNSKVSNFPNKKRMKPKQSNFEEVCNLKKDCVSIEYLDRLISALQDKKPGHNFHQTITNYLMLNWPKTISDFQDKKRFRLENDLILDLINSEVEEEGQMSEIPENSGNWNNQKSVDRKKKKSLKVGNEKKQNKISASSFETLMKCINSALGNDKHICDLEITPITSQKVGDKEFIYNPAILQRLTNETLDFTDIMKAFNNFDYDRKNSFESEAFCISPGPPSKFQVENELSTALIDEIDLHLEFQNYLKECKNINENKTKGEDIESDNGLSIKKNEFSKINEFRSSYTSASSIRSEEEENVNQFEVFVDCKRHIMSLSEECLGRRPTKAFNSQKETEIRKIRSENDPRKLLQETKLKSSIKRTFGRTSFHTIHLDDKETLIPQNRSSLNKGFSVNHSTDNYEKITPYGTISNKTCNNGKTRNRNRALFEKLVYSQSADSVPQPLREVSSDMRQSVIGAFDQVKVADNVQLREKSCSSEIMSTPCLDPLVSSSKWSLTLQDLIDIYNTILKENKKSNRNIKNSVNNSFSSHLITFLKEKLKEKQFKEDLLKCSQNFSSSCKPPSNWKPLKMQRNSVDVKKYVSMFQEILQSSLTISQIARLNEIISDLETYSEKNYNILKDLKKATEAEKETVSEKSETLPKKVNVERKTKSFSSSKLPKTRVPINVPRKIAKISKRSSVHSRSSLKCSKSEITKTSTKDKTYESELENMLRICFDSVNGLCCDFEAPSVKNRALVTVKLSGSRILVNDLFYINSEDALDLPQETNPEGTSELIIENVTKDQLKDAWYDTKCTKFKNLTRSQVKEKSKTSNLKRSGRFDSEVKISKVGKPSRSKERKAKGILRDTGDEDSSRREGISPQQYKPSEIVFPFEYNEKKLRVQHPIDAIVESSETKMSEIFENSKRDKSKQKPETPSSKKISLKNTPKHSTELKVTLEEALKENIFSKDLIEKYDWTVNEIDNELSRTKSFVSRRQTAKGRHTKKKERAKKVKSMIELNSKPCIKRKVPPARLRETYFCFPSIYSLEDKSLKSNVKPKEKFRDKNVVSRCASLKTTAKSSPAHSAKRGSLRKMSLDLRPERKKSDDFATTSLRPQAPDSMSSGQNMEKSWSKGALHRNHKVAPESTSVEVLLKENLNDSSPLSADSFLANRALRTSAQQCPIQVRSETKHSSQIISGSDIQLPIMQHPAKSTLDDISFPVMIIHSDSFLKCLSQAALTKSKLVSLLKFNSDVRFNSGRKTKNGKDDKSFITLVLTPEQKKISVPPSDKIQIDREAAPAAPALAPASEEAGGVVNARQDDDAAEDKFDKIDEKKSLESIERFINEYSKCRKKAAKRNLSKENKKNGSKKLMQNSSSFNSKKKSLNQTLPTSGFRPERKAYHEYQQRKKTLARIDVKIKKGRKPPNKTGAAQTDKIKVIEKKHNNEKTSKFFPSKIKNFIKVLENVKKKHNKEGKKINKREENNTFVFLSSCKAKPSIMEIMSKTSVDDTMIGTETKGTEDDFSSKNPDNFLPEVLEAIKTALSQMEDVKNKSEIISVIENELEKKNRKLCEEATFESLAKPPPSQKLVKIKIHCAESKSPKQDREEGKSVRSLPVGKVGLLEEVKPCRPPPRSQPMDDVELLNSLVLGETETTNLERQNSTYFDALEKALSDETSGAGEKMDDSKMMVHKPSKCSPNLNAEFGIKKESQTNFYPPGIPSEEKLFSRNFSSKESEEEILKELSKSLEEDKVSYSMALLDEFLKKIENSENSSDDFFALRRMLFLIENKSRNLMMTMEKSAWLSMLSLLEEVPNIFESEDVEGSMRGRLQVTKAFIDKIQALNMSRLTDLQNFCRTMSQPPVAKSEESNARNFFVKICESLNFLKQKFILKRGSSQNEKEKSRDVKNINQEIESITKLHSTVSFLELCENVNQNNEKNRAEHLQKKIQEQKACLEQLIKPEMEFIPQEIQDVKNKVAKKIRWLEKIFEFYNSGKSSKDNAGAWYKATSLLNAVKSCRKNDTEHSKDPNVPKNGGSNRSSGYVDMMQNLMKAWDTRLSLNSFLSEGIR